MSPLAMSRRGNAPPFLAMEIAREAGRRQAAGEQISRFDVGQPCFGAPKAALRAVERALPSQTLGYSDGLGLLALREAIAQRYARTEGLDISPGRIAITTGASGAFLLVFLALFDAGARVAVASPGYPPYRHILRSLGVDPIILEGVEAEGLQLTARAIDAAGAVDGALVASPANPTGAILCETQLSALCAAMRTRGKPLISDEIYHGLTYDDHKARSALAFDDSVVVVSSFSKYWAMTGWRVGWIVAPPHLMPRLEALAQNFTVAPPTISQVAALGALEADEECRERLALYAANRSLLLEALTALKLQPASTPDGAFYVLADISAHSDDSLAFSKKLLDVAGVATTSGVDFCESRGGRWLRFAYCRPAEEVARGVERMAKAL